MLKKVISYIEKNKILQDGDSVLLGVSGGADSVCMLNVLYSLREKYHLKLYVVHVNHGIRGSEAKRDADFVEQMAENLQIPFRVVTANIPLERRAHLKGRLVRKYRLLGLMLFVAIPLPGTGAWTGALIAAFLNIRLRHALPAITLGLLIAGSLVTLMTLGLIHLL